MRLEEIITEQQIDEAPQGFLSRMGSRVKAFAGDKRAQGDLEAGKEANWLKDQFEIYLGKIKKDATPQLLIDFLKKNNYPTGAAEEEMSKVTTGQKIGSAVGTVAGGIGKGISNVAKGIGNVAQGAVDAVKGGIKGAKDAMAKQDAQKTDTDQNTNTQTGNQPNQNTQTGNQSNTDNGISIKGGKKKIPLPSEKKLVNQSIDWSEAQFIFEDDAAVVLSSGQLDKIFMAAVRQAIERDEGGQIDTGKGSAPADAQGGGFGGALKSAGQSAKDQFAKPGSKLPPELADQLSNLPMREKQQLMRLL